MKGFTLLVFILQKITNIFDDNLKLVFVIASLVLQSISDFFDRLNEPKKVIKYSHY